MSKLLPILFPIIYFVLGVFFHNTLVISIALLLFVGVSIAIIKYRDNEESIDTIGAVSLSFVVPIILFIFQYSPDIGDGGNTIYINEGSRIKHFNYDCRLLDKNKPIKKHAIYSLMFGYDNCRFCLYMNDGILEEFEDEYETAIREQYGRK